MHTTFGKTRIAPTPSGYLHIGNVLSFATTAALAGRTGAKILLRIDDMDRDRVEREYVQDIFDTLNFLEIPWHEGPRNYEEFEQEYSQVHRLPLYSAALQQLWEVGHVFACTCSRAQVLSHSKDGSYPGTCRHKGLPPDTKDACWRLRTDVNAVVHMRTLQGIEEHPFPTLMADPVIRKKDGYPAYQLSSVVDDMHYGVDLVVRGMDLRPSTLVQLYLAKLLRAGSFLDTTFHHHGLVSGADGMKLSKSAGATSVRYLREQYGTREEVWRVIRQCGNVITI
ncbi:tRNA glutamyl-Q(34) synthetase GluQRS [Nemorincola caseinilytica]|uniref:tRNA glutamyl-Q(34) synthetase GluQRS n=1 Tax=Nemorincola caseinilytica TaxID=2054315 RepID=A0ABP8NNE4_9BACT